MDSSIPTRYDLNVVDDSERRLFELSLTSADTRDICILVQEWPSSSGSLDSGSERASVLAADMKLPARDDSFGYCPGGCGAIRIRPGQTLNGFITYAQFGDADAVAGLERRTLQFAVHPYPCTKDERIVPPR